MSIPILQSKLSPPPLPPNYLPRTRLDQRWDEWTDRRVILVTAGAGFGKTSLLSARARTLGRRCLWYTVDETDADLGSFLTHLACLAHGREPEAEAGRAADEPGLAATAVLAALSGALESRGRSPLLVFDDLHLLADAPGARGFLERLIRILPETATLVLSSRESIDLGLARTRAQGRVAGLTADELRLTPAEVEALYRRRFPDSEHPPRLFGRIVERTEGWAVGVEIFLQNLEGSSAAAIDAALARVATAGTGWFAYFAEEVLRRLDPSTQDFVCRCALLPRCDPELCDAALGRNDSRALLERLCARNLFTFAGEGQPPVYRFHRLFREFLLEQLQGRCPAEERRRLYRSAARVLARDRAWVEALTASVEGGDRAGALRLVERVGEGLLTSGQYQAVERALRRIPERELRRHAGALFLLGRLRDVQAHWLEAEAFYRRALRLSTSSRQRVELWRLLGRLQCRHGHYGGSRACFQRAHSEPGSRDGRLRGRLVVQLAVSNCELGRIDEAEAGFREGIRLFRRHRDRFEEARTEVLLAANVCRVRGEFRRGRDLVRRALVTFETLGAPRQVCHATCMLADLMLLSGERRAAATLASDGLRRAEALEFPSVAAHAHQTLGRIAMLEGDLSLARAHLEKTVEIGEALEEQEFAVLPRLALAEVALARGNLHAARRMARTALASASRTRTPWQIGKSHLLLGLLERSAVPAGMHRRRAESLFRRIGSLYELHHVCLLRLAAGDVPVRQRRSMLEQLLAGVARLEHDSLFRTIEPDAGAQVLVEALRLGVEVEFASSVLVDLGPRAVPHLQTLMDDPKPATRAVELLTLIGGEGARAALNRAAGQPGDAGRAAREALSGSVAGPAAPLRIRALGEFEVAAGARRLDHESWRSARALRLFLLLLHHRFRWVPREVLLESLWPEAAPEKGANNLRQTIHLLRGALEPGLAKNQPSRYIRVGNEACRLDPGEGYEYDVEALEAALRRAERNWDARPQGRSRSALEEALALYAGDFLAEYPYEEFAATEREHLRDRVLLAMERLLELLAAARDWSEVEVLSRRALALDAYRESHHRHLVLAQLRLGHRREALAACDAYDARMVREMGLPPSERMQALTEEVLALGAPSRRR